VAQLDQLLITFDINWRDALKQTNRWRGKLVR
jgi:hypothetical protein